MTQTTKKIIDKLPKKKDKKFIHILGIIIAISIVIIIIICSVTQRTYNSYSVIKSNPRTDSMTKGYLRHNGDIVKYSTDGISVYGQDFKTIWSASYSMKNPSVAMSENYIAVADIGGKEINVYDKKGTAKKIDNSKEICQIEVSDSGMVAIMTKENMAYFITIANSTKKYIDIKTRIKEDGYPLDMAFSSDSKKLVTSYLKIEDGEVNNYVTFYNFGEVGKNYESKIVKGDSYGKVLVPKVEFLDKNTVCVFSQERFTVYEMKEMPEEKFKTKKYDQIIRSVICNNDYVGIVVDNKDGDKKTLNLWGKDGRKKLTKEIDFNYDDIEIVNDDIIMRSDRDAMIVRTSGKVKFQGEFKEDVEYIMPYNYRDKYYFITQQSIDKIKLANK